MRYDHQDRLTAREAMVSFPVLILVTCNLTTQINCLLTIAKYLVYIFISEQKNSGLHHILIDVLAVLVIDMHAVLLKLVSE